MGVSEELNRNYSRDSLKKYHGNTTEILEAHDVHPWPERAECVSPESDKISWEFLSSPGTSEDLLTSPGSSRDLLGPPGISWDLPITNGSK